MVNPIDMDDLGVMPHDFGNLHMDFTIQNGTI